jgi:hypothetical protein
MAAYEKGSKEALRLGPPVAGAIARGNLQPLRSGTDLSLHHAAVRPGDRVLALVIASQRRMVASW